MKAKPVILISLFLLGLLLLFSKKERSPTKPSEASVQTLQKSISHIPDTKPHRAPTQGEAKFVEQLPDVSAQTKLVHAAASLEPLVQSELSKIGFTQDEIDQTLKALIDEYLDGDDTISLSDVVDKIAKDLKLDSAKKNEMNAALLRAVADNSRITFDQWNQCLTFRTAKSSDCLKDAAQELSRTVASGLQGSDWSKDEFSLAYAVVDRFTEEAAGKCREDPETIHTALKLTLGECPL